MNTFLSAKNFAAIGVGGYIAPRHLKAIRDTGNNLIAAVDPFDSVGILDRYFYKVDFFTEIERFDRHLEKLRRERPLEEQAHYMSIMSPNYLHDAHCRLGLRLNMDVICEKPLVINPWNLDQLAAIEAESEGQINTILQLRVHPSLLRLKKKLEESNHGQHEVMLTYITSRGPWYHVSWKGDSEKSGGIATNIGIHFFDLLQWLFGEPGDIRVYLSEKHRMSGFIELERAKVHWFLSVDEEDLPFPVEPGEPRTYRSITVDGEEIEFSGGFTDLHTRVYEKTLAGDGFGVEDARPSIELSYQIRTSELAEVDDMAHPILRGKGL